MPGNMLMLPADRLLIRGLEIVSEFATFLLQSSLHLM
jgi:hypothetical protein